MLSSQTNTNHQGASSASSSAVIHREDMPSHRAWSRLVCPVVYLRWRRPHESHACAADLHEQAMRAQLSIVVGEIVAEPRTEAPVTAFRSPAPGTMFPRLGGVRAAPAVNEPLGASCSPHACSSPSVELARGQGVQFLPCG